MTEHLYSTYTIKEWLKNLEDILYPRRDNSMKMVPIKGHRPYDNVSYRRLTGVILKSAIKALPKRLQRIVLMRWLKHYPLSETLKALNMTKDQYYYSCDKAVELITYYCNNQTEKFEKAVERYN